MVQIYINEKGFDLENWLSKNKINYDKADGTFYNILDFENLFFAKDLICDYAKYRLEQFINKEVKQKDLSRIVFKICYKKLYELCDVKAIIEKELKDLNNRICLDGFYNFRCKKIQMMFSKIYLCYMEKIAALIFYDETIKTLKSIAKSNKQLIDKIYLTVKRNKFIIKNEKNMDISNLVLSPYMSFFASKEDALLNALINLSPGQIYLNEECYNMQVLDTIKRVFWDRIIIV